MRLGKVNFTKQGFEDFQKLTKKKQIEKLRKRMPLELNLERFLKGVKYGKHSKDKRKTKASEESTEASKDGGKRNSKRSRNKRKKD